MTNLERISTDRLALISQALPLLPSSVRYYDDFSEKQRSISDLATQDQWTIHSNGQRVAIDFAKLEPSLKAIHKRIALDLLMRLDSGTVSSICNYMIKNVDYLAFAVLSSPSEFRTFWITNVQSSQSWTFSFNLRITMHSLCNLSIGMWTPELRQYISQLESPPRDIYKTVRTGECFLPTSQQALLIEHLDRISEIVVKDPIRIDANKLIDACLLILTHQYGFRPGQIARLKTSNVRDFENGSVHCTVRLLKQRDKEAFRQVTRRIKREWCPIFIEQTARRRQWDPHQNVAPDNYFNLKPIAVSRRLSALLLDLTETHWNPMDLRHTAAQRMADAGTPHIVLSEFMGHATTLSANVYFEASPNQAQRVNEALALSPIYSNLAEVAKLRKIDKSSLLRLPPDQQIGGVPHGVPISGIGACGAGQSLCTKNPVLSCYTCRKFMPLSDITVHEAVVESLRPVVTQFANSSRFNEQSPSYVQLGRMLNAATQVIEDMREPVNAKNLK